jgi:choline kinase
MKNPVVKAIVLCAGEGKRLRPLSENKPKCMVSLKGKPLLSYQLSIFQQLGISDVTLIGGYCSGQLPQSYNIIINKHYPETNMLYSLFCAADEIDTNKHIIVSYGDIIYSASILEQLLKSSYKLTVITDVDWLSYWKKRMDNPLHDVESFKWNSTTKRIYELGQKPQTLEEIQGQYIGLFKISKDYISEWKFQYEKFCHYHKSPEKAYMTDFLQWLIDNGQELYGLPIHGQWAEFDTLKDLKIGEKIL